MCWIRLLCRDARGTGTSYIVGGMNAIVFRKTVLYSISRHFIGVGTKPLGPGHAGCKRSDLTQLGRTAWYGSNLGIKDAREAPTGTRRYLRRYGRRHTALWRGQHPRSASPG